MSNPAFHRAIKSVFELIDSKNERNFLNTRVSVYLVPTVPMRTLLESYNITGNIAKNLIKEHQERTKAFQNPSKGIFWDGRRKSLTFYTVPGKSAEGYRNNYSQVYKHLNTKFQEAIRKYNKDVELNVGHVLQSNVVSGTYHSFFDTSETQAELNTTGKGIKNIVSVRDAARKAFFTTEKKFQTMFQQELNSNMGGLRFDAKYYKRVHKDNAEGHLVVGLTPMSKEFNLHLANTLESSGPDGFKTILKQNILKNLGIKDLANLEGSPSYIRMLKTRLTAAFLAQRDRDQFSSNKFSKNSVPKKRGKAHVSYPQGPKERRQFVRSGSSEITLLGLLNAQLHRIIKLNMGKGNSNTKLNYRTGRFAESVKVVDVDLYDAPANEALIDYTYQENPYNVFAPGGRLYKPNRNPRVIINASIRQLARAILDKRFKLSPRHVGDSGYTPPRR